MQRHGRGGKNLASLGAPYAATSARLPAQGVRVYLCSLPSSTCRCRGRVHLRVGQKAVSFAQDCRQIGTGTRRHSR
jgi:hypothetical protein